jgi:peptidoglycan-associated lipoprotein
VQTPRCRRAAASASARRAPRAADGHSASFSHGDTERPVFHAQLVLNLTPAIGTVAPEGMTSVTPSDSTTYTITATGPGGSANANVRVTVTPPPPAAPAASTTSLDELFAQEVKDAYFDLDKADIRADARNALSMTAQFLRSYPQIKVAIEGHCDERGSTEYNIALGDRRAQAAKDFIVSLGVPADRIQTVSYGKERPFCTEHDEACWQQNRRAHFVMAK